MDIEIISLEGNIGSGKSTFLKHLQTDLDNKNYNNIIFVDEPVDEWNQIKDDLGETILSKFYKNPEHYSFPFQMMAFITRYNKLKEAYLKAKKMISADLYSPNFKKPIIITERSLFTDKYVFAKMLYDDNKIENINYKIYCKWFDEFAKEFPITKIVYISTDPVKCFERILNRNRNGENNISKEYLLNCHDYHNEMVEIYEKDDTVKILKNENNYDIENNNYKSLINTTTEFITCIR